MNRFFPLCLLIVLFGMGANAGVSKKFSEECEKMRDTIVVLTNNLRAIDTEAVRIASKLESKGGRPDLHTYNQAVLGIADAIDTLSAKINKACN